MTMPIQPPYAVFAGSLGDNATGNWYPAQAEVSNGFVTLWVGSPAGWTQYFSVPATEVTVKSAAQRITLVVRGQSYPILAKPRAVGRAIGYGVAGTAASVLDKPVFGAGVDVGRGVNQAAAASAWNTGGGPEFIVAARNSGAQVSRLGYGPLIAIGCGGGVAVVILVVVVTLIAINL
ncbi:hypothetical protein QFZ53_001227 [Microbacterium natoriense]|uniref:Uncharacterized protein n=1 Tax=Microbacterium natoriense TaxID=284570 RepID=A0AAW8EUQ8_9MICO|nr:hypothetical protein [Microbacterium natoriense]MDQ0647031.1 hypothetical protein [Microbacterium natoriense]